MGGGGPGAGTDEVWDEKPTKMRQTQDYSCTGTGEAGRAQLLLYLRSLPDHMRYSAGHEIYAYNRNVRVRAVQPAAQYDRRAWLPAPQEEADSLGEPGAPPGPEPLCQRR